MGVVDPILETRHGGRYSIECPFLSTLGGSNSASCKGILLDGLTEKLLKNLYGKKKVASYVTIRRKIFIKSYTMGMN